MLEPVSPPVGRPVISAVTGTNGKTSVATATLQIMRAIGWCAAGYDSTGVDEVDGRLRPSGVRRSPDYLPELIDSQAARGAQAISLEAFVGILADGLFERVNVDVAVCTGLERDHLDVHRSLEAYWGAKLSLFEQHLRADGIAVLASDCAQRDLVETAARRRGARVVIVDAGGDRPRHDERARRVRPDVRLLDARRVDDRIDGRLEIGDETLAVVLPTVHAVAATNLLLAATAVIAAGGPAPQVVGALAEVKPPPGRLETVAERDGVRAMVDTAHNPGALRTALDSVRASTSGRLLLVFGAGGERDRAKRPEMGAIAASRADLVILTDDNPRREPPQRIRDEVRAGCPDCLEIPRRADAIRAAIEMARPGDTVLVAGKGDEHDQLIGGRRVPHDDREVIRQGL